MDELIVIFTFILIISSIALGVGSYIHKNHIRHEERKAELEREKSGAGSTKYDAKIARLEDRVRVLERLATDRKQDLADQIEDLRRLPDADLTQSLRDKA